MAKTNQKVVYQVEFVKGNYEWNPPVGNGYRNQCNIPNSSRNDYWITVKKSECESLENYMRNLDSVINWRIRNTTQSNP